MKCKTSTENSSSSIWYFYSGRFQAHGPSGISGVSVFCFTSVFQTSSEKVSFPSMRSAHSYAVSFIAAESNLTCLHFTLYCGSILHLNSNLSRESWLEYWRTMRRGRGCRKVTFGRCFWGVWQFFKNWCKKRTWQHFLHWTELWTSELKWDKIYNSLSIFLLFPSQKQFFFKE